MKPEQKTAPEKARVLAISSGKGGVGKSNISINLAIALARGGKKVCVFDADTSLANVNILLDIVPQYTLEHLLHGQASLDQLLLDACGGISIIPAASGIAEFSELNTQQQKVLLDALRELEKRYDYLLIDTAAGIGSNVTTFLNAVTHTLLVVTPEPTSLTDAFALMKVLRRQKARTTLYILTNRVDSYPASIDIYKRLAGAAKKYLQLELQYFGYIPNDDCLRLAVQQQRPVLISYPGAAISARFMSLARSTDQLLGRQPAAGSFSLFWQRLFTRGLPSREERASVGQNASIPFASRSAAEQLPSATPGAPAATPSSTEKVSRSLVLNLQQNMAQLIKSRILPSSAMQKLLSSLLLLTARYYPDIRLHELTPPGQTQADRQDSKPGSDRHRSPASQKNTGHERHSPSHNNSPVASTGSADR